MEKLKAADTPRDRGPTIRLLTILTILFFSTLCIGTIAGGLFVRESIKEERLVLAEDKLNGFAKALKTVFEITAHGAQTLADSINLTDGLEFSHFEQSAKTYLATAPWTTAVILQRPDRKLIYPQSATEAVQTLSLPDDAPPDQLFFGPYELPGGERALVYRIAAKEGVIELVIGFRSVLEAVGLLEFAQSTQFSVETSDGENSGVTAGNTELISDEEALHTTIETGNAKWTIRIRPAPLDKGPHNWARILTIFAVILLFSFVTPFIALLLLLRARLQDNRHIRESKAAIEDLSRHLEVALKASNIGLWEHDLETGEQRWDNQILKLYGVEGQGNIHSFEEWLTLVHPDERERFRNFAWQRDSDPNSVIEYRIITPAGTERTLRSAGNGYQDASGRRKFVGVNWDITSDKALQEALAEAKAKAEAHNAELEEARRQMEQIALEDSLTGIANRRHFESKLESARNDGTLRAGAKIVLIDLDGFKTLNDTMGHFFGDDVLRFAARIFSEKLGPKDFLARTGGDEFVVLMPPESDVDAFTRELTEAFSKPIEIDGRSCRVGISIGIAGAESQSENASELLVKADLALYEAKNRGRGRTVRYTSDLMAQTFALKRLADDLQEALERGEITAFFQPIYDSRTSEVIGVEALARWRHPQRGLIEPSEFIGVADQISLLHKIDEVIFNKAVDVLKRCDSARIPHPVMSVNVSAQRLQDPELLSQVADADLPPGRVHFELLESIPFDNSENELLETVRAVRDLGIGIDLDDFGSGYASLLGLTRVQPDRLKIAGQLITPIVSSAGSLVMVETIARMAKSFEIDVICEGVLSSQHREKLDSIGCHLQQGYHFSRPMDEEQIIQYLARRR